jgi:RNA polymerase sigma factor (sigma-70 family)
MEPDTAIGGLSARFPATRHSAVLRAGSPDREDRVRALETIVAAYWKPVYKHLRIRRRLSNEDAKDLTQAFFTSLIEKDWCRSFSPGKGTFRTFLRTCVDRFAANRQEAARAAKRVPDLPFLVLDANAADQELAAVSQLSSPEDAFREEWIKALLQLAVDRLRQQATAIGRTAPFRAWELYDLQDAEDRPTYATIAVELETTPANVTNWITAMRRDFRSILLTALRELTASDHEFEAEAAALFGMRLP